MSSTAYPTGQSIATQADDITITSLANDLKRIEAEMLPQLDELQAKIPEIYNGYASLIRETVSSTLNYLSSDSRSASKIAIGAEIAARSLEAFGQWKAAKKHNELLDRHITLKKMIAQNNMAKISRLLTEARRKLDTSHRLLDKSATTNYSLADLDCDRTRRLSALTLRHLDLYRTNLFLVELAMYLDKEYRSWAAGRHTSGAEMPDYYAVNGLIMNQLFTEEPFKAIERCADSTGYLSGAEIMLLSDPQLSLYALKDSLCTISPENASPSVRVLITGNPGFHHYIAVTEEMVSHVGYDPDGGISFAFLLTVIAIIALCIFYLSGAWWLRTIICISGLSAAYKIFNKNYFKAKLHHCEKGRMIASDADDQIARRCGKIEQPSFDYERKNATTAFLSTFFAR